MNMLGKMDVVKAETAYNNVLTGFVIHLLLYLLKIILCLLNKMLWKPLHYLCRCLHIISHIEVRKMNQ